MQFDCFEIFADLHRITLTTVNCSHDKLLIVHSTGLQSKYVSFPLDQPKSKYKLLNTKIAACFNHLKLMYVIEIHTHKKRVKITTKFEKIFLIHLTLLSYIVASRPGRIFFTNFCGLLRISELLSCSRHQNNQIYEFRIPNIFN